MKRTKQGVSLIVLVITIIVMIILASAVMISLSNTNIINQATEAVDANNLKEVQNIAVLAFAESYIKKLDGETVDIRADVKAKLVEAGLDPDDYAIEYTDTGVDVLAKGWAQKDNKVLKGDYELEVGDTISNYTATGYTGAWKVLGADKGKLLLISDDNVRASEGLYGLNGGTVNTVTYAAGYNNGIAHLNEVCSSYLNVTYADKARSITVEDVNRVTGYNPLKTATGEVYHANRITQYGNEVTYTYSKDASGNETLKYESVAASEKYSAHQEEYAGFKLANGKQLSELGTTTLKSTYYWYCAETLSNDNINEAPIIGLKQGDKAYDLLFNTKNSKYWLASSYVFTCETTAFKASEFGPSYGLFSCDYIPGDKGGGKVSGMILQLCIPSDIRPDGAVNVGPNEPKVGVRAVIELKTDVTVEPTGTLGEYKLAI